MATHPYEVVSTDTRHRQTAGPEVADDFTDRRRTGKVIGSRSSSGHVRLGTDIEGVLSIDNHALRIAPLIEAGFGRAGIAYGPLRARPGLAFSVFMLNGHNTAQSEPLSDTFRTRIAYWLKGSGSDKRSARIIAWLRSGRVRRVLRQFRRWKRTAVGGRPVPTLNENLAIGWFSNPIVPDPRIEGCTFIMHALGPENGELWAGASPVHTRALRGVQNLPIYYVAVMRNGGTVYYVTSLDVATGPGPYPWLRPVAVDTRPLSGEAYASIQQSVLGQIGWRLDSRVYGVRIADIRGYESWCGGAHAADALLEDPVRGAEAEIGGPWQDWTDHHLQDNTNDSSVDAAAATLAVLDPGEPSGLVHAVAILESDAECEAGVVLRFVDPANYWRLTVNSRACKLVVVINGTPRVMASLDINNAASDECRIQVLDDGCSLMAYLDGRPLSENWITDDSHNEATRTGIIYSASRPGRRAIQAFEAHPRLFRIPAELDMGAPWIRKGVRTVAADDFSGEPMDLNGRLTTSGGMRWKRLMGTGAIETTGSSKARIKTPCPDRTAYCVDWPDPQFVDIEVTITPPGTGAGQKQRTTAGFILYQDARNYVTLNAYRSDYYPAGSVSTFFKFDGFEDTYDAIWSNVADRIDHGKPLRLRLCCDGEQYIVFINDEAVLYRAFRDVYPNVRRLAIRKAGILANWEFGMDTGSTFEQCTLRI